MVRNLLEVVVGQDRDRPLGRQAALDQRLRDCARVGERLGKGEVLPVAAGVAEMASRVC